MVDFRVAIVVDDQERLQMMTAAIQDIFTVSSFNQAEPLLREVEKKKIDLVIIEFNIQGYNGIRLQQEINKLNPEVHTVMITSVDHSKCVVESMKKRAMDYLYGTDDPGRFANDVCKLVRYIINEKRYKEAEKILKETELYPIVRKIYDEREVDLEELKRDIEAFKKGLNVR